jgi:perosamine synthetase
MCNKIFLDAPNIGEDEKRYVNEALDTGYVSTAGPFVPQFEDAFAAYIGTEKAVSTQSGTAALHMALHELGIGEGDEVIVPALTFVATVNPIVYMGAKPVFVDVDIDTWNIDPRKIEEAITEKTKAIIPVHLYGNPCDMDSIMQIAQKHGLYVIEDATESLGARYRGKHTGTLGHFGCFSFNGNKTITTGGGGMIVGKDTKKIEHIKFLVNQARDSSLVYYHSEVGFNYRMTNIEAALGLAQLNRLEKLLEKKKIFNRIYKEKLGDSDAVSFQKESENSKSSNWLTCVCFKGDTDVSRIQKELGAKNIPTRRIFMPLVEFPQFKGSRSGDMKNSYEVYERGLCLPSSTLNEKDSIKLVCEMLRSTIGRYK